MGALPVTMSPTRAARELLRVRTGVGRAWLREAGLVLTGPGGRARVIVADVLAHLRTHPVPRAPSRPAPRPPARRADLAGEQVPNVGTQRRPDPINWPARGDRPAVRCSVIRKRGVLGRRDADGATRFYWRARVEGTRAAKCPGWATRAEAFDVVEAWVRQLDAVAAAGGAYLTPIDANLTVGTLLAEWLSYMASTAGWRATTMEAKAKKVRGVTARLGSLRVAAVDSALIARYKVRRLRDVSPGTLNGDLDVLASALRWAESTGTVPGYTAPDCSRLAYTPERSATVPEPAAMAALLAWLDEREPWAASVVRLLAETGLRMREAWRLHWRDVEVDADGVRWLSVTGKSGDRVVPLSDVAVAALDALRPAPDAAGFTAEPRGRVVRRMTFPAFECRVRPALSRWCSASGGDIRPHDLRAWRAASLLDAGVDAHTYERWMGHSYAVAVKHYLRKRSRAAMVDALHRLNAAASAAQATPLRRREGG